MKKKQIVETRQQTHILSEKVRHVLQSEKVLGSVTFDLISDHTVVLTEYHGRVFIPIHCSSSYHLQR
jgi:hypothetical protein